MHWKVKAALRFADTIKPGIWTRSIAEILSFTLRLIAPREKTALKNIETVFPGISSSKKEDILAASYENMVWTGLELMSLHKNPELIKEYVVEEEGVEHLKNALARNKGAILISCHIGNWELSAAWGAQLCNMAAIARSADNEIHREIIEELRKAENTWIIDKTEPMTRVLGHIKNKGAIGLLSDQHAGNEGIVVPFFGRETGTVKGAGVFAYLTGAPIIPYMAERIAPFKLKIKVYPEVKWEKGPDRDSTIKDITVLCNSALEQMIRDNPGQWLWQHRRFREMEYND